LGAPEIEKAKRIKGRKLILRAGRPADGLGFDPQHTVEIARLAVRTGLWPLKEYEDGVITHTKCPAERAPVEEYLKLQGRSPTCLAATQRGAARRDPGQKSIATGTG